MSSLVYKIKNFNIPIALLNRYTGKKNIIELPMMEFNYKTQKFDIESNEKKYAVSQEVLKDYNAMNESIRTGSLTNSLKKKFGFNEIKKLSDFESFSLTNSNIAFFKLIFKELEKNDIYSDLEACADNGKYIPLVFLGFYYTSKKPDFIQKLKSSKKLRKILYSFPFGVLYELLAYQPDEEIKIRDASIESLIKLQIETVLECDKIELLKNPKEFFTLSIFFDDFEILPLEIKNFTINLLLKNQKLKSLNILPENISKEELGYILSNSKLIRKLLKINNKSGAHYFSIITVNHYDILTNQFGNLPSISKKSLRYFYFKFFLEFLARESFNRANSADNLIKLLDLAFKYYCDRSIYNSLFLSELGVILSINNLSDADKNSFLKALMLIANKSMSNKTLENIVKNFNDIKEYKLLRNLNIAADDLAKLTEMRIKPSLLSLILIYLS